MPDTRKPGHYLLFCLLLPLFQEAIACFQCLNASVFILCLIFMMTLFEIEPVASWQAIQTINPALWTSYKRRPLEGHELLCFHSE